MDIEYSSRIQALPQHNVAASKLYWHWRIEATFSGTNCPPALQPSSQLVSPALRGPCSAQTAAQHFNLSFEQIPCAAQRIPRQNHMDPRKIFENPSSATTQRNKRASTELEPKSAKTSDIKEMLGKSIRIVENTQNAPID